MSESNPMQAHITRHYRQNCGDHAADVTAAHHYDPDERVEDMLCRVLGFPVSRWSEPDPSEVVTLQRLAAMGIGLGSVSSASGVSVATIQGVRNGRSKRVRPDIAAALLAVAPIHDMAEPGVLVDAQQTRDRIEMLIGQGWTQQRIAAEAGVSLSSVERLCAGRHSRIRAATANRIAYLGVCNLIRNVREVR